MLDPAWGDADERPGNPRAARIDVDRLDGRVRAHAQDQPAAVAATTTRLRGAPCWPAAASAAARPSARPARTAWRSRNGRCRCPTSWPRSAWRSASIRSSTTLQRRPADPYRRQDRHADPGGAGMNRRAGMWCAAAAGLALLGAVPWTAADAPRRPRRRRRRAGPPLPGGGRPGVFRLHLFLDGKPYGVSWSRSSKSSISSTATATACSQGGSRPGAGRPPAGSDVPRRALRHGGLQRRRTIRGDERRPRRQSDAGGFLAYYRRTEGGPAQLAGTSVTAAPKRQRLTETLFKILDTDKDGKLSRS